VGLVLASRLSVELKFVDSPVVDRVMALLNKYNLPVSLSRELSLEDLLAAARKDKKARAGRMRYVAMRSLGDAITVDGVDEGLVLKLWQSVA